MSITTYMRMLFVSHGASQDGTMAFSICKIQNVQNSFNITSYISYSSSIICQPVKIFAYNLSEMIFAKLLSISTMNMHINIPKTTTY